MSEAEQLTAVALSTEADSSEMLEGHVSDACESEVWSSSSDGGTEELHGFIDTSDRDNDPAEWRGELDRWLCGFPGQAAERARARVGVGAAPPAGQPNAPEKKISSTHANRTRLLALLHDAVKSFSTVHELLTQCGWEDSIFTFIDKDGDGKITLEDLKKYWSAHGPSLNDEQAICAFEYLDPTALGYLDEKNLQEVVSPTYHCVSRCALFLRDTSTNRGKILRHLKAGEVLHSLREVKDEKGVLLRIHVKALSDQRVGWVEVRSDNGSICVERMFSQEHVLWALDRGWKEKSSVRLEVAPPVAPAARLMVEDPDFDAEEGNDGAEPHPEKAQSEALPAGPEDLIEEESPAKTEYKAIPSQ
jgi:hypothetical protein